MLSFWTHFEISLLFRLSIVSRWTRCWMGCALHHARPWCGSALGDMQRRGVSAGWVLKLDDEASDRGLIGGWGNGDRACAEYPLQDPVHVRDCAKLPLRSAAAATQQRSDRDAGKKKLVACVLSCFSWLPPFAFSAEWLESGQARLARLCWRIHTPHGNTTTLSCLPVCVRSARVICGFFSYARERSRGRTPGYLRTAVVWLLWMAWRGLCEM